MDANFFIKQGLVIETSCFQWECAPPPLHVCVGYYFIRSYILCITPLLPLFFISVFICFSSPSICGRLICLVIKETVFCKEYVSLLWQHICGRTSPAKIFKPEPFVLHCMCAIACVHVLLTVVDTSSQAIRKQ